MVPSTELHNTVQSAAYMHIYTTLYRIIAHAQHDTRPRIQSQLNAYNDHGGPPDRVKSGSRGQFWN